MVGPDAVADWAWRIPFLIAAPLGLIGLYMRTRLQDTPAFEQLKASGSQERTPIRHAFRHHKTAMLVILVGSASVVTSGYLLITFMVSFLTSTVGVSKDTALLTNTIAIAVYGAATVLAGLLSDRFGRRPVFLTSVALQAILAVPLFLWISQGDTVGILLGQSLLAALNGGIVAPFAVLCVELFPANIRYAASGIGYSVGSGLLGGIAPLAATALVSSTGLTIAPALYLIGFLLVTLVVFAVFLRETAGLSFEEEDLLTTAVTPSTT